MGLQIIKQLAIRVLNEDMMTFGFPKELNNQRIMDDTSLLSTSSSIWRGDIAMVEMAC